MRSEGAAPFASLRQQRVKSKCAILDALELVDGDAKLGCDLPQNTGVMAVMSGRWVPPWKGSLLNSVSPG